MAMDDLRESEPAAPPEASQHSRSAGQDPAWFPLCRRLTGGTGQTWTEQSCAKEGLPTGYETYLVDTSIRNSCRARRRICVGRGGPPNRAHHRVPPVASRPRPPARRSPELQPLLQRDCAGACLCSSGSHLQRTRGESLPREHGKIPRRQRERDAPATVQGARQDVTSQRRYESDLPQVHSRAATRTATRGGIAPELYCGLGLPYLRSYRGDV